MVRELHMLALHRPGSIEKTVRPIEGGIHLLSQQISCKLHVMINLGNIYALSDFNRNSKGFIRKLKQSGKPAVLTVNGQAEVVIQSAEAYQKLLEDQRLLETIRGISRGLDQAKRGEGQPMRALIEELASEYGISLK